MILTKRQQQVLDFIQAAQARDGIVPSTREIQEHFGFASQTAAMNHLRALERKGAIKRLHGKARAMSVVSSLKRERIVDIPIYGQIAAGLTELTEQDHLGVLSIDSISGGFGKKARVFALKVRGDSMIGANINDGDLVILEIRPPKNEDIVAALVDGETTLKRYVTTGGKPFLKAENPRFPEIHAVSELVVQGVMVALIRQM